MRALLVAMGFLSIVGVAAAEEKITLDDGRTIVLQDDGRYVVLPPTKPDRGYRKISVEDLKLDIDSLDGVSIEAKVKLQATINMIMIADPSLQFDSNMIIAEGDSLPREDRQYILKTCNMGCNITIRAVVSNVMFQPGLKLESLVR